MTQIDPVGAICQIRQGTVWPVESAEGQPQEPKVMNHVNSAPEAASAKAAGPTRDRVRSC